MEKRLYIRPYVDTDKAKLEELYKKYYHHEINLDTVVAKYVVHDGEDKIIAFGFLQPWLEAITVTDAGRELGEKLGALNALIETARDVTRLSGVDKLLVFAENKKFDNTLVNRFGFSRLRGNALVLEGGESGSEQRIQEH